MGTIAEVGKRGRELLFHILPLEIAQHCEDQKEKRLKTRRGRE